jgi:putative transposase
VWELTTVQACIIHLIRNTFRYASRKYWDQIAHDLRPVYTAANEAEAWARFEEFAGKWGKPYPAIKMNRPGFVGGCVVYAASRLGVSVLACR